MRIPRKMVGKIAVLLTVSILFFVPVSGDPCEKADISQNTCCCCESYCQSSPTNGMEQNECPCQMSENPKQESPSAVLVSHQDGKPEIFLLTSEVEPITQYHSSQLTNLYPYPFVLLNRDPPLYLLNSSFLI